MICVQQPRAQEADADEEIGVCFLAVKAHQRDDTDKQRQENGGGLHERMELGTALPSRIPQKQMDIPEADKERDVRHRPADWSVIPHRHLAVFSVSGQCLQNFPSPVPRASEGLKPLDPGPAGSAEAVR